jgi:hypothetical protein
MTIKNAFRRTTGTSLLLSGIGLLLVSPVLAADGPACDAPTVAPGIDCKKCDKIFSDAAGQVAKDYDRLMKQCSEPSCTDATCDGACGSSDVCDCCEGRLERLFDDCCGNNWLRDNGLFLNGYLQQGLTFNPDNPGNGQNTPMTFNDQSNSYLLNQFYLSLGRAVDTDSCESNFGFQVDMVFGSDARFTKAAGLDTSWGAGNSTYQFSMPQAYLQWYAPIGNGLTVKAGHFYTTIGYEVVTSPDNFFYSHAYTMQYGEPFTHTGFLAEYALNDNVSVSGGIVSGWDDFENEDDQYSFLGGVTWSDDCDVTSVALNVIYGDETTSSGGTSITDRRSMYSFVMTHNLSDCTTLVLQHDRGIQDSHAANAGADAEWYGINTYLFHQMSDKVRAGIRYEWFRDDDGTQVAGGATGAGGYLAPVGASYQAVTMGLNYQINDCLLLRPEMRYDWQKGGGATKAYDDGNDNDQFTFGSDLILRF